MSGKLWMLGCGLLLSGLAAGVEPKSGDGGTAIRKAQGLIRQISQEKMALEADKAALLSEKTQLEARVKLLEEAVRRLQPLQGELERYKTALETTRSSFDGQLAGERQQYQALVHKHNDVVAKANAIYADNQLLVQAVEEREQWLGKCSAANARLQALDRDMLEKYRNRGFFDKLADLDAITGIGRIDAENAAEDFRFRLQQLQITPFQSPAAAPDAGTAAGPGAAPAETRPAGTAADANAEAP